MKKNINIEFIISPLKHHNSLLRLTFKVNI